MDSPFSKRTLFTAAVALTATATIGTAAVLAATPEIATDVKPVVEKLVPELAGLFVVATVMESALTTLFTWRLYREFFNGRAVKTVVMFAFGLAVVQVFDYDIFHRIIIASGGTGDPGTISAILSALVLAGGSAAVNELFKRLGLRSPLPAPEDTPKPGQGKAWVSVRIVPAKTIVGDLGIHIDALAAPTEDEKAIPPLAGVLAKRTIVERFKSVFSTDPLRFPPSGGRTVDAGATVYRIVVTGRRKSGDGGILESFAEEIHLGRFAERAIIDLVRTIE